MAALPYMQFYIAEYLADTAHFTTEEHGAYLLLMFNYWQRGKPLPNNDDRLARIAGLSNERWADVKRTLSECFNITPTEWRHKRIDADLAEVAEKAEKASKAGKASGEARKRQAREARKQEASNERSTNDEQTLNHIEQNRTDNISNPNGLLVDGEPSTCDCEVEKPGTPDCPHQEIINLYHAHCPTLPEVKTWGPDRQKFLRSRWRESPKHQTLAFWEGFFKHANDSPFLRGEVNSFQADLEFLVRPKGFRRVIEGYYHRERN